MKAGHKGTMALSQDALPEHPEPLSLHYYPIHEMLDGWLRGVRQDDTQEITARGDGLRELGTILGVLLGDGCYWEDKQIILSWKVMHLVFGTL